MRSLSALLLAIAALDLPVPGLDRAGVALLGLAAIAFALPAGRSLLGRVEEKPRGPAIHELDDELERDASTAAARALDYLGNRSPAA